MQIIGPEPRGKQLRAAANRMRWEVDYALGVAPGAPEQTMHDALAVSSSLHELSETIAILRQIMVTIEKHLPPELAEGDRRRLGGLLLHYESFHQVGR